jgi:hypothetical protein
MYGQRDFYLDAKNQYVVNVFHYDDKTVFYTTALAKLPDLLQGINNGLWEKFKHEIFTILVINGNSPMTKAALLCGNCNSKGMVKKILGITPSAQMKIALESLTENKILCLDFSDDDNFFKDNAKLLKEFYERRDGNKYKVANIILNCFGFMSNSGELLVWKVLDEFDCLRKEEVTKTKSKDIYAGSTSCCGIL